MRDRILVIDDEPNLLKILSAMLSRKGYEVLSYAGFDLALGSLNSEDIDVVITDLSMPQKTGMDVLAYCRQYSPDLPVVMITAFGTVESAVGALKAGAFDFITKPFEQSDLFQVVEKAIESRRRRKREPALEMMSASGLGQVQVPLFGNQPDTVSLRQTVERISQSRSHVFILGEIGTGKRSVASEIHRYSDRARGPFVQLHCEAVPPAFQVSELIGIEKGASPIAFVSRPGKLELALGGTLLLDEVTALSVDAQNELFLALERESFSRIGGAKDYPLDLRIVATSSKSKSMDFFLNSAGFHFELFQKLSVEVLQLKPLRERPVDLETHLAPYYFDRAFRRRGIEAASPSAELLDWIKRQSWTGNLGELEKKIEQAVNLYDPMLHGQRVTLPSGW